MDIGGGESTSIALAAGRERSGFVLSVFASPDLLFRQIAVT